MIAESNTSLRHGLPSAEPGGSLVLLQHEIEHAAHLLPAQGPITVFIHHNTLHAFEDMPFDDAVKKGARIFGCQPYLSEDRYRAELAKGRIRFSDLQDVLREDLGRRGDEEILRLGTRLDLRLAMLQYPFLSGPKDELVWFVAETDALKHIRPEASAAARGRLISETRRWVMRDLRGGNEAARNGGAKKHSAVVPENLASLFERFPLATVEDWSDEQWESFTLQVLWRVCCDGLREAPAFTLPQAVPPRPRDLLLEATGADSDPLVHDLLIRFCAAFLDQGFAHWQLPRHDEGIYRSFFALYGKAGGPPDLWLRDLVPELARLELYTPLESIRESLELLGITPAECEDFLASTFLALRGWGGMVQQIELRGDRVAHPAPLGSTIELLAIRLILDRLALAHLARETLGHTGSLRALREALQRRIHASSAPSVEQRAFQVFQLAQVLGLSPDMLHHLESHEWAQLLDEIDAFSGVERRRLFQRAFERRLRTQTLDAAALHGPKAQPMKSTPRFQAIFCLDEREESFRRHLEELQPDVETFGAAGFFSVAMYYKGAADAHFVPLCPVVIRPQHWVAEQVVDGLEAEHRRKRETQRRIGKASHQFHVGSRSFALGALLTGAVGVLASFPLVARILFPRLTARIRRRFGRIVQTPPLTRLQLERKEAEPGPENGHVGFSVDEMAAIAERLLRDIGLTHGFSPLVLIVGHGSNSLNNPHKSAYDCGACGGAAGGPNARALAQILNDPRIRDLLRPRGIDIPDGTFFVGGFHNTCNDTVPFFDLHAVPETHQAEFATARKQIEETCDRNAHERSRRFMSAPLTMSYAAARLHVEERAEDLAQTRPECGHASNALCIVGRRFRTRGLFLDRRAFLVSYDPLQDDGEAAVLSRILAAVFPVCAGINLEYYFSYVDSPGWGCGSKLPHNITSLLGVMDGAASDLRTGLPWQMVEIHEPVRLLFLIETTPALMTKIMDRNEGIGRLCRNGWVQLALVDPESGDVSVFQDGTFRRYYPQAEQLPQAKSSVDWYRGWRDHLEFAAIGG
jgi:uncharacterized protein YbcC (UPF0753/DUF2309 family)